VGYFFAIANILFQTTLTSTSRVTSIIF